MVHRRAVEVVLWGMPADLTPNLDVFYFFSFINPKDVGAVVMEIPPVSHRPTAMCGAEGANALKIEGHPKAIILRLR